MIVYNEDFIIEKYTIEDKELIRVKDNQNRYWYPLAQFLRLILLQKDPKSLRYRDDERYSPYMMVFPLTLENSPIPNRIYKTWCMETQGMITLLKLASVKDKYKTRAIRKSKYLAAARNFFNIGETADTPDYIGYMPDISNYDVWSIMCIQADRNITRQTVWKKCEKCGFYYPDTNRYFSETTNKYLARKCRQCLGRDFVCMDKKKQFLYTNNGLDLLFSYYEKESDKEIAEKFRDWIEGVKS